MDDPSAVLALALDGIAGIGRVTIGKILRDVPSYDHLLKYPYEQLLHRIKGVPRAGDISRTLLDEPTMRPRLQSAAKLLADLQEKGIHIITPAADTWPARVDDLPPKYRPAVLYVYGHVAALQRPAVSFFARPPLSEEPFEAAQHLLGEIVKSGAMPVAGAHHGFDVVIHKRAASWNRTGSMLVAHVGLRQIPRLMRPVASTAVRSGGALISPFTMTHGPFDHEDVERAHLQAALSHICIFLNAPDSSPEARALEWAAKPNRPLFVWPGSVSDPPPSARRLNQSGETPELLSLLGDMEE